MPKCVQSSEPVRRTATAPSIQTASSTSCDTPETERWTLSVGIQQQRRERRRGRHDRVAQAPGDREARRRRCRSSAATGRRSRGRRRRHAGSPRSVTTRKPPLGRFDDRARDGPRRAARRPRSRLAQQRVEHVARAVGVGKQLAAGLLVQRDADLAEERDRLADGERAQHAPDDRGLAAPEIALGDDGVGHVAARSAADEDLRAGRARAVEEDDRTGAIEAAGEDRGGQAGRAGADDGDVARRRELGCQSRSLPCRHGRKRFVRRYFGVRAARGAAEEFRLLILRHADDFRAVAAAFRTERRRALRGKPAGRSVVHHGAGKVTLRARR